MKSVSGIAQVAIFLELKKFAYVHFTIYIALYSL